MNKDILNGFIKNIHSEEPIIIFGSSAMFFHELSKDFHDVDLALSKKGIQKLYKRLLEDNSILINGREEKIKGVKMGNINNNNFGESLKLRFKINGLEFEGFVEKAERNSLFGKYFKDLNKYTKSVGKSNVFILKPKYLSEAYIKIASNELEHFNKTLETLDTNFKLEPGTNLKELNNFLEKNGEVFDKKILKIFKRKDNIKKIKNFKLN